VRRISTRRAADLLGNLVAEMAARRHAARVICVHNTVARRPIDVRICRNERVASAHVYTLTDMLMRGPADPASL